jgi:hypothetical protein
MTAPTFAPVASVSQDPSFRGRRWRGKYRPRFTGEVSVNHPGAPAFATLTPRADGTIDRNPTLGTAAPTFARAGTAYHWNGFFAAFQNTPAAVPRFHGARWVSNWFADGTDPNVKGGTATTVHSSSATMFDLTLGPAGGDNDSFDVKSATGGARLSEVIANRYFIASFEVKLHDSEIDSSGNFQIRLRRANGTGSGVNLDPVVFTKTWTRFVSKVYLDTDAGALGLRLLVRGVDSTGFSKRIEIRNWMAEEITHRRVKSPSIANNVVSDAPSEHPGYDTVGNGTVGYKWRWDTLANTVVAATGVVTNATGGPLHPTRTLDGLLVFETYPFVIRNTVYTTGQRRVPDGLRPFGTGELVTNGLFGSSTTGWAEITGTGSLSVPGNVLRVTNGEAVKAVGSTLGAQSIPTRVGSQYRLRLDGFNGTSGGWGVLVSNAAATVIVKDVAGVDVNYTFTTSGAVDVVFVANDTVTHIFLSVGSAAINQHSEFDNVSITRINDQTSVYLECVTGGTTAVAAGGANTVNRLWGVQEGQPPIGFQITDGTVVWEVKGRYTRQSGFVGFHSEPAVANLMGDGNANFDSRNFSSTDWDNLGPPTVAAAVGADGRTLNLSIQDTDAGASQYAGENEVTGFTPSVAHACSVFIRKRVVNSDYPRLWARYSGGAGTKTQDELLDPQTGSKATLIGDGAGYVEDWGHWWRYISVMTGAADNTQLDFRCYPAASLNGTAGSNAAVGATVFDFPMIELADYASSPIWNAGASVTRIVDTLTYAGTWGDGISTSAGILRLDYAPFGFGQSPNDLLVDNTTFLMRHRPLAVDIQMNDSTTTLENGVGTIPHTPVEGQHRPHHIACCWAAVDSVAAAARKRLRISGAATQSDGAFDLTMPKGGTLRVGHGSGPVRSINGVAGGIMVWPAGFTGNENVAVETLGKYDGG